MNPNNIKTTIDLKELKVFQDLGTEWWESKGMQILKIVNRKITNYIIEQIIKNGMANKCYERTSTPLCGLKVLEVGCGGGFLSEYLVRTGCDLIGIDPNESLLQVAKDHGNSDPTLPKITYLPELIEEHCIHNAEQYDVVVSNFVLEHVSDPDYFITCCSKCVKPGGSLFISTVAKTYLAWFILIFLIEYVLKLIPIGVHSLDKFINASVTENFIKSCNFKIKHTQGFFYDLLTGKAFNVPIHSCLYMVHAVNQNYNAEENNKP